MKTKPLPQWVVTDLKNSALTQDLGKKMGLRALSAEEATELIGRDCKGAYEIPYHTLENVRMRFSRYKLVIPLSMGKDGTMRYWQPPKSPPRLYFCPLIDWRKVKSDEKIEVWVTEGEKKAAALCALGVPCLAVSGVWAWRSKRMHEAMVPEFKALLPRDLVLCFDSDAEENLDIKGALSMLAVELERRGGKVRLVSLPQLGDSKTGLDDFILAKGRQALKELALLPKEPMGLSAALNALNAEVCVIENEGSVYSLKQGKFFSPEALKKVVYADMHVQVYDASGALRKIPVIDSWLTWPGRRTAKRLAYAPGRPPVTEDNELNLWRPGGVEPRRKPCPLFTQLLDFLAHNLGPEEKRWWLQWLAYPLQHPGAKLYSAVIMYSHRGGTGKTLLGYTLQRIYGEHNCAEVDQSELHSGFNTWATRRQFIIGAEISGSDKRSDSDKLKHMVTRKTITINEKYQPVYTLDDTCNYYLTTNHADAVYIEQGDRRYFVVDTSAQPLSDDFYRKYDEFYKSDAGIAAIYGWLMAVDLAGFRPEAAPPQTAAKVAMHEVSGSEVDAIVRDLVRDPTGMVTLDGAANKKELFTLEGLQALLDPTGRMSRIQIGKALRKAGAPQPFRVGLPTAGGAPQKTVVLHAIANFDRWKAATHGERVAHYLGEELARDRRTEKVGAKPRKANGRAGVH